MAHLGKKWLALPLAPKGGVDAVMKK